MRLLLTLAVYAALTVSSVAQPPQELVGTDTMRLQPGEARVFTFDQPVTKITLADDGVVQIVPESDRVFTFRALKSGAVLMSAFSPENKLIHRSNIVVSGGMVRIYGTLERDERRDYVGYICTEFGCGRADPELEKPNSVAVTRRNSRGDIITTTKQH